MMIVALVICVPAISLPYTVGRERSVVRNINDVRQVATAILIQQQALQAWYQLNPGTYGVVPTASLTIPAPWSPVTETVSEVQLSGSYVVGVTYYAGTRFRATDLLGAMTAATSDSGDVGITAAGWLQSPQGNVVPLPNGVPVGYAAIAEVF
jgi:hypothetical protein